MYNVNAKKSGIYNSMLHKALDQLDICEQKWGCVLVVRFDLHQSFYSKNNEVVRNFFNRLNKQLKSKYSMTEVGYFWVREVEKSKNTHWHCVLFLDGSKVRHSKKVLERVRKTWERKNECNHVPTIKNPYYFMNKEEVKEDVIYRLSYLAKARGKGYRDPQAKDYATSRLIAPANPKSLKQTKQIWQAPVLRLITSPAIKMDNHPDDNGQNQDNSRLIVIKPDTAINGNATVTLR